MDREEAAIEAALMALGGSAAAQPPALPARLQARVLADAARMADALTSVPADGDSDGDAAEGGHASAGQPVAQAGTERAPIAAVAPVRAAAGQPAASRPAELGPQDRRGRSAGRGADRRDARRGADRRDVRRGGGSAFARVAPLAAMAASLAIGLGFGLGGANPMAPFADAPAVTQGPAAGADVHLSALAELFDDDRGF
ncbi:MAG: hypothetical protein AAF677_09565 [Pseudomonadota bacterium]